MGVRLRNTFYSTEGNVFKIDIIDDDYSSTILEFTTATPGFELKYTGGKERYDPIFASEVTIFAMSSGAVVEDLIDDIAEATEGRFFVKIYKNTVLQWTGKLLPDKVKKEDIYYPYTFNMTFTDGVGALKEIDFDDSGTLYSGREDFIGIICKILNKTGIADQFEANDSFLKTCVHWYDEHHNFYANWDPLKYSDVLHQAFYDFKDDENLPKKCWDVLVEILTTFGCHIKQAGGLFQVIQPNEYINDTLMTRTYNKSGVFKSYNFAEVYRTAYIFYDRLKGGNYTYYPPLYFVSRKYIYRQSPEGRNILPVQATYNTATDFLSDIAGGDGEILKFYGTVNESYTLNQYQEPFQIKYRIDVCITEAGGEKRYLTNGTNGTGQIQWSSNSGKYMTYWSKCGVHPTLNYNAPFVIQFNSHTIPWDATGTFRMQYVGTYDFDYNPINLIGGITFDFTCLNFLMELIYPNQISSEGFVFFKAENNSAGNKSKMIELPDSYIGDGPNTLSMGRIKTSDGYTSVNSTFWGIKTHPKEKKIHQLLVNEILLGQQIPCDIYDGTIFSTTYSAEMCLGFVGPAVYVPLGITFSAMNDEWRGQWWKIKLAEGALQEGLTLEEGNYDPDADWYLQSWDSEPIDETEKDVPTPDAGLTEGYLAQQNSINTSRIASLINICSISYLTTAISEGKTLTSIEVDQITDKLLATSDRIQIISDSGAYEDLQLNAAQGAGDMDLTIVSHTFESDFPIGSRIIFNVKNLIKKINDVWILKGGTWDDDGAWKDSDVWKDTP